MPDQCDLDPNNPVDMTAEDWRELYAELGDEADDLIERDESP